MTRSRYQISHAPNGFSQSVRVILQMGSLPGERWFNWKLMLDFPRTHRHFLLSDICSVMTSVVLDDHVAQNCLSSQSGKTYPFVVSQFSSPLPLLSPAHCSVSWFPLWCALVFLKARIYKISLVRSTY